MKRFACAMLALCLLLAACGGALAEATLLCELPDVSAQWIENTDLLRFYDGLDTGHNSIAGMDGATLTEPIYSFQMSGENGLIVTIKTDEAEGFNCWGALNLSCAEVLPFQYGDIEVLSPDWALGIVLEKTDSDDYDYAAFADDGMNYRIQTVDVYSLAGAGLVATLSREQYVRANVMDGLLYVEDRATGEATAYDAGFNPVYTGLRSVLDDSQANVHSYYEDGKYGLMDAQGNVLLAPTYDSIYNFDGDYAMVSLDEHYGLIDRSGNVVVPAEYDSIDQGYRAPYGGDSYENCGYFCVEKDGKLGYVTAGGAVTCEPKYSVEECDLDNYGVSAAGEIDGKPVILAADGRETDLSAAGYSEGDVASNSRGLFYRVENAEGDYGLIDLYGNELLPCEFVDMSMSGDGFHVLAQREYGEPAVIYELSDPLSAS